MTSQERADAIAKLITLDRDQSSAAETQYIALIAALVNHLFEQLEYMADRLDHIESNTRS